MQVKTGDILSFCAIYKTEGTHDITDDNTEKNIFFTEETVGDPGAIYHNHDTQGLSNRVRIDQGFLFIFWWNIHLIEIQRNA